MATEYEIRISNRSGALQYILTPRKGLLSLAYQKRVNAVGFCQFTVNSTNEIVGNIDLDWQVAIRRRDNALWLPWYTDFEGLFRDEQRATDGNGVSTFTAVCVDGNDWLTRSIVGYKSGVTDRSAFSGKKAETIAKTIVTRNATSAGSVGDGRVRAVDAWGAFVTVQVNASTGNTLNYACAYRPLLESLQEIADIGGGDFNMVLTGATTWDFRWYNGQLGSDKSNYVVFSEDADNMANPVLKRTRSSEYTIAIVAGEEVGTARNIVVGTGDNYNATYNSAELYVDARDAGTALLAARGDVRLEEARARDELSFEVLQKGYIRYGEAGSNVNFYKLGDLVTGYYQGVTAVKQVAGVSISYAASDNNPESIAIELADL